jgi:hypothetical protein
VGLKSGELNDEPDKGLKVSRRKGENRGKFRGRKQGVCLKIPLPFPLEN